ncbi:tRNA1(Val) (adenine(37)-N6)-methyltransferase [Chelatococcus sp. GCM10030263]|uniref:tRNA1(Val) (adenine(37)-N6)-methyltransferase n=1 Tax=Chelatococcus sp. GCM10030263 TaxID=3273387 RepID=UPI0036201B53
MASAVGPDACTTDSLFGGRLRLIQPRRGHRAGTDAVLLAAAAGDVGAAHVVDLGAGVGTVGLAVAQASPAARVRLVEREPALVALARDNVAANGLDGRVEVVEADVLAPAATRRAGGLLSHSADMVVTNPPFFARGRVRASPDAGRRAAHVMDEAALEAWLRTAADLAAPGGRLVMIHEAPALQAILTGLAGRFGAIALKPVYPRAGEPATRLLVGGVKGSRAPLRLLHGLVLHEPDGRFTVEAEAVHRGEASVVLA